MRALLFLLVFATCAQAEQVRHGAMYTTIVVGHSVPSPPTTAKRKTFQAVVEGTGTVTSTVIIEVSNYPNANITADTAQWKAVKTFNLSGTTVDNDVYQIDAAYANYRVNVTGLSAGARATVYVGEEP